MKNFIGSLLKNVGSARVKKAEHEIAHQLWTNEYRYESFDYILSMVRSGQVNSLGYGATK